MEIKLKLLMNMEGGGVGSFLRPSRAALLYMHEVLLDSCLAIWFAGVFG